MLNKIKTGSTNFLDLLKDARLNKIPKTKHAISLHKNQVILYPFFFQRNKTTRFMLAE